MNCLGSIIVNSTYFLIYQSKVSCDAMCARIVSSDMQRRVVKIFILHGAARRHFHYVLGHLWGGALISVPGTRIRGIYIDENMKFISHINKITNTVSRNVGMMSRIRHFVETKQLLQLYNAIILPNLNYCCLIWRTGYAHHTKKNC